MSVKGRSKRKNNIVQSMLNMLPVSVIVMPVALLSFSRSLPAKSTNTILPNLTIMCPEIYFERKVDDIGNRK